MINWQYFPVNLKVDDLSKRIVGVFEKIGNDVDSSKYGLHSDDVLAIASRGFERLNFRVEKSKKNNDKIHVPVLYGINGSTKLSFDADAYNEEQRYVVEVEAGRAVTNYQFLKDFFEVCAMSDVDYLCIAVRNTYKASKDFNKVIAFFNALYASERIKIPLKGLLIIGY